MDENEHILLDVVGLYCFILALVGTFGNLVCSYVCFSHRLRGMTTFVFLGCMLIADTVCLYVWCFDHFVERYFRKSEAKTSAILCRFEVFVQFVSLETSSWLLVIIACFVDGELFVINVNFIYQIICLCLIKGCNKRGQMVESSGESMAYALF